MCGIVGVTGSAKAATVLLEGLKRLEYRGYDSAGLAICRPGSQLIFKEEGKIRNLEARLDGEDLSGTCGIAHTRWATHGAPNQVNAHPHLAGKVAVVHNGIIENHSALKVQLGKKGRVFKSETDTEVLAHLIDDLYTGDLVEAVQRALAVVEGAFGIAVTHVDHPDLIVGARKGSPLVVGIGEGVNYLASDVAAILEHTRQVIYLDDGEMVTLRPSGIATMNINNEEITKEIQEITWDLSQIQKGGYDHFMLKEIFEQPRTIRDSFRGRTLVEAGDVKLGGIQLTDFELRNIRRIIILACGTSFHAGLVGEYMLEEYAHIPVEVEYASEFRYRSPIIEPGTLCLVISQSGETIDTLEAMREAKRKGAKVLGITNVVGSTIARESEGGVYIHAGPEIGVASTKAFTSQVTILGLITILLGRRGHINADRGTKMLQELERIPELVQRVLDDAEKIKAIAQVYARHRNCLYLGRGVNFPIALEGALKLKEISYIHAEGYSAGEMKHGPIALIDEHLPTVGIATQGPFYEKTVSNLEEVKARDGKLIIIATEGDSKIAATADDVVLVPANDPLIDPILTVVPMQLIAYHIADLNGTDVDQPRNLAKSVTVE